MMMQKNLLDFYKPRANTETIFDSLDVSEETRKDYSARVGLFLSYVGEQGFNKQSCLSFKKYLASRTDYSVATKNKYLATARVFVKQLIRHGMLPLDVNYSVKQFRQSKRHRRQGLTDNEVRLLGVKLKFLPDTPRNRRLRALFALLAFQGLRQVEIVRLDVDDINLTRKTAFVRGKGEDDKELVYLAPATIDALRAHIEANSHEGDPLFQSMGNRKVGRLSTMTIQRELGGLLECLGSEKSVHGFRHFYITELLKNMDVREVQKFSRHRSLETVLVYDDETNLEQKAKRVFDVLERFRETF